MAHQHTATDEELALGAQGGSEQDFNALVDRYTPAVYRLARGITGGPQDAEDVVQETFVRAFKNLASFAPSKGPFKTWLLTIARNQSINVFGSLRRRALRFLCGLDISEQGPGGAEGRFSPLHMDAESLMALKQEHFLVEQALNKLPERQRTALVLKAHEGMNYDEIARVMNTSVSSVESLIFRGRKRILEVLKD
jgi:RNA polymerase sigma-70 factor (ECF subfamily)